jgi:hypothetical protein
MLPRQRSTRPFLGSLRFISRQTIHTAALGAALASATVLAACTDSTAQGMGTLRLQLTDAPFSSDSVSRVDVYVTGSGLIFTPVIRGTTK